MKNTNPLTAIKICSADLEFYAVASSEFLETEKIYFGFVH